MTTRILIIGFFIFAAAGCGQAKFGSIESTAPNSGLAVQDLPGDGTVDETGDPTDGVGDVIVDTDGDGDPDVIDVDVVDEVEDARCGKEGQDHKVLVCHHPCGNVENRHEICISKSALKAHINKHGDENDKDYLGACQ